MVARNNNNSKNKNANKSATTQPDNNEEGFIKVSLVNQSVFIRRKKSCPLRDIAVADINYKNLKLLNKFLSERGKIIPSRITNVAVKKQKAIANAIKRARHLALISPVKKEVTPN
jgi:small subunit ribosomal protein S18